MAEIINHPLRNRIGDDEPIHSTLLPEVSMLAREQAYENAISEMQQVLRDTDRVRLKMLTVLNELQALANSRQKENGG